MHALIAANAPLERAAKTWQSIAGIGATTAIALLALMPELGSLDRRKAAALAGLAPHPRQSGKTDAYRRTRGGRPEVSASCSWPPSQPNSTTKHSNPSINASSPTAKNPSSRSPHSCANLSSSQTPNCATLNAQSELLTAACYRFTSKVGVPSLLSLRAIPFAASSSRMRSDSFQFFAARAALRSSTNLRTCGSAASASTLAKSTS